MNNSNKRWFGKTRINNTIQNDKCNKSLVNMYKLKMISLLVCPGEPVEEMLQHGGLGIRRLLLFRNGGGRGGLLITSLLLRWTRGSWLPRHQGVVVVVVVDSHGLLHRRRLFRLPRHRCFNEHTSYGWVLLRSASRVQGPSRCLLRCCRWLRVLDTHEHFT